jgi:predicted metal-dependent hydrolase
MTYPVSAQLELPFAPASLNPVVNFSVTLADTPVEYVLHRSGGRRRISISVDERGLRVGAPLRASLREIEGVLRDHAAWVIKKLSEWRNKRPPTRRWVSGETVCYLGLPRRLDIQAGATAVTPLNSVLMVCVPDAASEKAALAAKGWLRQQALAHFQQRIEHFRTHFTLQSVSIRLSNARSRWGSCHTSGRISLNWRLIHLPSHLIDYVVVHELAHLVEMNHSPRFWAVVARVIPDYAARRREIRKESHRYVAD